VEEPRSAPGGFDTVLELVKPPQQSDAVLPNHGLRREIAGSARAVSPAQGPPPRSMLAFESRVPAASSGLAVIPWGCCVSRLPPAAGPFTRDCWCAPLIQQQSAPVVGTPTLEKRQLNKQPRRCTARDYAALAEATEAAPWPG